jgi:peroxiredoxin
VAISPQTREKSAEVKQAHTLGFPVLWDAGNAYAGALGLVHGYPDDLRAVYEGLGIRLDEANGDDSWTLPVPARFVVDASGIIRSVEADPDYTRRPEPDDTLRVLESL